MTREEIIAKVNSVLAEEFEVDESEITPDANIKDTFELDSLSLVDLVALIDQTFKVKIQTSDLPSVKTFAALYDYIEQHQKA
jgi:acyl carrier protein